MCLYSRKREPFIAEEDIPCYKELFRTSRNVYVSPYQRMKYTIGGFNYPMDEPKEIKRDEYSYIMFGRIVYVIDSGYLHCYADVKKNEKRIRNVKENQNSCNTDHLYIFDCYIPKGSEYYISTDGCEICTNKLFVKPLEKEYRELTWFERFKNLF